MTHTPQDWLNVSVYPPEFTWVRDLRRAKVCAIRTPWLDSYAYSSHIKKWCKKADYQDEHPESFWRKAVAQISRDKRYKKLEREEAIAKIKRNNPDAFRKKVK